MRATIQCVIPLVLLALTVDCVVVDRGGRPPRGEPAVVKSRRGPPPHAPAHGYRRKFERDGVKLLFDAGLGVYVVVDLDDVFFFEDRYYRYDRGRWLLSSRPREGWVVVEIVDLPEGLRRYKGRKKDRRGRGGRK